MLVPVIVGIGLVGAYLYDKKRKETANQLAAASTNTNADRGYTTPAQPASNAMGSIQYTPPTITPGFNTTAQTVQAPQGQGIAYPPATTKDDPATHSKYVIAYQAAQPIPSNVSYYPVAGDVWPIVVGRLAGTSKARLTAGADYAKAHPEDPIKTIPVEQLGKLNGFVTFRDLDQWIKAGKPLKLPEGAYHDVSGPVPSAMGSIR